VVSAPTGTLDAIEQLRLYFASLETRQGILARQVLGQPCPGDEELAQKLVLRMVADIRPDGSVTGGVVATIWRAHELLDLGCDVADAAFGRLLGWMMDLQRRRGSFSQGCTPARHSYRACEHFLSGFFSPGPPEQRIAPVMFPCGKVFRAEPAARFAVSCLALRAALRAGFSARQQIEQHTTSLAQLQPQWGDWRGYFAPDVIVEGVHALASTTGSHRRMAPQLGGGIVSNQAEDGTWSNADLFHTIDSLLAVGTQEARTAIRRAIPALLAKQRADGSFGSTAQQERSLIALRALIWAEQEG
jgi:hypothetical protein